MRIDKKGRRSLVYHMAGSPLSGSNRSSVVREDGKIETVTLSPFINHWSPFIKINTRYTEAKVRYQAYTLQEVLDILHREDNGKLDFDHVITTRFMQHEIDSLKKRLKKREEELSQRAEMWYKLYADEHIRGVVKSCRSFVISPHNLALIGTRYSYRDYDEFYERTFLPLQISNEELLQIPETLPQPEEDDEDFLPGEKQAEPAKQQSADDDFDFDDLF